MIGILKILKISFIKIYNNIFGITHQMSMQLNKKKIDLYKFVYMIMKQDLVSMLQHIMSLVNIQDKIL